MEKKKFILYSIVIFLVGLIVTAGSYAYWQWASNDNKSVVFNTIQNLSNYVEYNEGDSSFVGDLNVSNSYLTGSIHSTISIYKTKADLNLLATIHMDVNAIGTNMKKSTALKWVVTEGTASTSNPNVLAKGNFVGINAGDTLTLVPDLSVNTTETFYTIWIWLDSSENPSNDLSGETLDTNVWTEINQIEDSEDRYEITRISANYQIISATVVDNKYKVVSYAITTTNSTPSSWTNIPSVDQANVYNLNTSEGVSGTGTYYVWFKDANDRVVSKSVQVTSIDTTAPVCTWGSFNPTQVQNGQTAQITLTCSDEQSQITIHNLTTSNIVPSNNKITVTNISKTSVTNGYQYTITVAGTNNDGTSNLTLPANSVKNAVNLGNTSVTSGDIIVANTYTVKYISNNNNCTLDNVVYADKTATYGTAFSVANPSCAGYNFVGWTADSGLDTTNAKYGSSSANNSWANASNPVKGTTTTYFNNLALTSTKMVTLTANWSAGELVFNNQTLNSGTYGTSYTSNAFDGAAYGTGSYTYTIKSGAPTGATINSANRTISFSSTTDAGTYNIVVTATDNNSGVNTDATMTIVINPKALTSNEITAYVVTWTNTPGTYQRTISTGVGSETVTLTYTPYTNAIGSYTYATTLANGKFTLSQSNSNYSIASAGGFTINGASITGSVAVSGTNRWGETLTASPSCTIPSSGCTFDNYQWYANDNNSNTGGQLISGATSATYIIDKEYVGKYIYAEVKAHASNYADKTLTSSQTAVIAKQDLTVTTANYSGTYDGSIHYATITVTSNQWNGQTIVSGTSTSYGTNVTTSGVVNTSYNLKPGYTDFTNGAQTVYYRVTGGTYYNDATGSATVNITKKTLTSTEIDAYSVTWASGTSYTRSGVATGIGSETITLVYTPYTNAVGTYTYAASNESGKFTLAINPANNNYSISSAGNLTINNASLSGGSVQISGTNTWGETLTATITDTSPVGNYSCSWYHTSISAGNKITDATVSNNTCTYTIDKEYIGETLYVQITASKDYYTSKTFSDATDGTANTTATVAKRNLMVTTANYSGAYDGNMHYATVRVTSSEWNGQTIVSGTSTSYGTNVTTSGVANTSYDLKPGYTDFTTMAQTVYYKVTGGTYYNDATGSATVNITKKALTSTEITAYTVSLASSSPYIRSDVATGVGSETITLQYTPYRNAIGTYSYAIVPGTGKYTLAINPANNNYSISSAGNFTISDAIAPTIDIQSSNGYDAETYANEQKFKIRLSDNESGLAAGTYIVKYALGNDSSNYNCSSSQMGDEISITATAGAASALSAEQTVNTGNSSKIYICNVTAVSDVASNSIPTNTTITATLKVDNVAPTIIPAPVGSIAGITDRNTYLSTQTFALRSSESYSGYQGGTITIKYKLYKYGDTEPTCADMTDTLTLTLTAGATGYVYTDLVTIDSGTYDYMKFCNVQAISDGAGNTRAANTLSIAYNMRVDRTAPASSLNGDTRSQWRKNQTFSFTLTDSRSGLAAGTYTLKYMLYLASEGRPSCSEIPSTSAVNIVVSTGGTTTATSPNITIDSGTYDSIAWCNTTVVSDVAGNTRAVNNIYGYGYNMYIDNTAPVIDIVSSSGYDVETYANEQKFKIKLSDANSGLAAGTYRVKYALGNGSAATNYDCSSSEMGGEISITATAGAASALSAEQTVNTGNSSRIYICNVTAVSDVATNSIAANTTKIKVLRVDNTKPTLAIAPVGSVSGITDRNTYLNEQLFAFRVYESYSGFEGGTIRIKYKLYKNGDTAPTCADMTDSVTLTIPSGTIGFVYSDVISSGNLETYDYIKFCNVDPIADSVGNTRAANTLSEVYNMKVDNAPPAIFSLNGDTRSEWHKSQTFSFTLGDSRSGLAAGTYTLKYKIYYNTDGNPTCAEIKNSPTGTVNFVVSTDGTTSVTSSDITINSGNANRIAWCNTTAISDVAGNVKPINNMYGYNYAFYLDNTAPTGIFSANKTGDVNLDGRIGSTDATAINNYLNNSAQLSERAMANADVNLNETVDSNDSSYISQYITGTLAPNVIPYVSNKMSLGFDMTDNVGITKWYYGLTNPDSTGSNITWNNVTSTTNLFTYRIVTQSTGTTSTGTLRYLAVQDSAGNIYKTSERIYRIIYDKNGGSGTLYNQLKLNGTPITLSGGRGLTKSGSVFNGWNTAADGSGTSYSAEDTYSDNATVTLYAQWITSSVATPTLTRTPESGWTNGTIAVTGTTTTTGITKWQYTFNVNATQTGSDATTQWKNTCTSGGSSCTINYSQARNQNTYIRACINDVCSSKVSTLIQVDKTAPVTMTLSANSDSTYTKTKSVTVTLRDADSGLASGASIRYGWSTSTSTAPSSYTTASFSYSAGTTGNVTFKAQGSGLSGSYYLWVVPTTYQDRAGNSNTTTVKSTGTFKFDNTAPTAPTYTASFVDGSGSYTSGTWTNKRVKVTFTTTESGSGVSSIDMATSTSGEWSSLSLSAQALSQSGSTWTAAETFGLRNRNDTYYFRACDELDNCSGASSSFNIRYDVSAPTATGVTGRIGGSNITASFTGATDANRSGIYRYWFKLQSSSSCGTTTSGYSYSTSNSYSFNSITTSGTYYVCGLLEDNAGNISDPYVSSPIAKPQATTLSCDIYRYQGSSSTVTNNYVCFGTNSKSTCTGNTGEYMYRILGIKANGSMKLVKQKPLSMNGDTRYPFSTINYATAGAGNFFKSTSPQNDTAFVTLNTTFLDSLSGDWEDYIVPTRWYSGYQHSYLNQTGEDMCNYEIGTDALLSPISTAKKVGLMYMHDYYLSVGANQSCAYFDDRYGQSVMDINCLNNNEFKANHCTPCKAGWLHLSNNGTSDANEWLMTGAADPGDIAYSATAAMAWAIRSDGGVLDAQTNGHSVIRPTFFTSTNVRIKSGTGTSSDPFILEMIS